MNSEVFLFFLLIRNFSCDESVIKTLLHYCKAIEPHIENTDTDLYKFFWLWGGWVGGGRGDW